MRRLPEDYDITRADSEEADRLVSIDREANTLFADTGLLSPDALLDPVPQGVLVGAIEAREVFVARHRASAQACGFAMTSQRGPSLYLEQVSVHPDHGRKGLGTALVRRVVEDARDRKFDSVTLSTFRDLPWNGPFYKSLGFREIRPGDQTDWMQELTALQAESLDVSKRCFMRRRTRWLAMTRR